MTTSAPKRPAKKAVAPVAEPVEIPEEVSMLLDLEQKKLEIATMEAQLAWLSSRLTELVKENYELRSKS